MERAFSENEKKEQISASAEGEMQTAQPVIPPACQPASQEYVNVGYTIPITEIKSDASISSASIFLCGL